MAPAKISSRKITPLPTPAQATMCHEEGNTDAPPRHLPGPPEVTVVGLRLPGKGATSRARDSRSWPAPVRSALPG